MRTTADLLTRQLYGVTFVGSLLYSGTMVHAQTPLSTLVPSWVRRIPLFPLLLTYIFVASGLVVAVVLVALSLLLWPFSKNTYRRVSSALASSVLGREWSAGARTTHVLLH